VSLTVGFFISVMFFTPLVRCSQPHFKSELPTPHHVEVTPSWGVEKRVKGGGGCQQSSSSSSKCMILYVS